MIEYLNYFRLQKRLHHQEPKTNREQDWDYFYAGSSLSDWEVKYLPKVKVERVVNLISHSLRDIFLNLFCATLRCITIFIFLFFKYICRQIAQLCAASKKKLLFSISRHYICIIIVSGIVEVNTVNVIIFLQIVLRLV